MSQNNEIELLDSFNKEQIQQLHKAILGFSEQSFELKKMCVTIQISVCTLVTTIFKDNYSDGKFIFIIKLIMVIIPLLFYTVDMCTYYYQDKLRAQMFNQENQIRERHNIPLTTNKRFERKKREQFSRIWRSIKSGSNIIYWGLLILATLFVMLI